MMARVIAIGGLKGGTGKSTLAVNLACQLAAGLRVYLIDVDRQESSQEWLAGSKLPVMGIALPLDDRRGATDWIRRVSAIDADMVLIDLPPQIGAATAAALILADGIVNLTSYVAFEPKTRIHDVIMPPPGHTSPVAKP